MMNERRYDTKGNVNERGTMINLGSGSFMDADTAEQRGIKAFDECVIEGYVCRYGKLFSPRNENKSYCFRRGCFNDSLKTISVSLLYDHNSAYQIGTTKDGVLEIFDDDGIGLAYRAHLPDTALGYAAKQVIRNKTCTATSIGHYTLDSDVRWFENKNVEFVNEAIISSISLVEFGALDDAFVIETSEDGTSLEYKCETGALLSTGWTVKLARNK